MFTALPRIMIDLHGLSVADAEKTVRYWLAKATQESYHKARFVTGRGNHVNKQGLRGTLYNSFLQWVEQSSYKDNIKDCQQYDGYFDIIFKSSKPEHVDNELFNNIADTILATQTAEIITQAEAGNPYFEFLYAVLLEEGKVVTQDYNKAADFSLRAANKHYSPAMFQLGRFYFHGIGIRQSDEKAVEWFEKADQAGDMDATLALGECYMLGHGVAKVDERKAVTYYAKAAAKGNRDAMRKLGSAYFTAHGIDKSAERAFFWYKKCADLGDATAQFNVGTYFWKGTGTKPHIPSALRYFKLSAENGDADAAYILGQVYLHGHLDDVKVSGFEQNEVLGLEWIKKSAEKGSVEANRFLMQRSSGQSSDVHLKRAADSGSPFAKYSLDMQTNPTALTEQEKDTLLDKRLLEAARLDERDIILLPLCERLTLLDFMLINTKKYHQKAICIFTTMAEGQCIYSLRRLYCLHRHGSERLHIPTDASRAMGYLKQGVTLNDATAMVELGRYYAEGSGGVSQSDEEAKKLYHQAAQLQHPGGYFYLSILMMQRKKDFDVQQLLDNMEKVIQYDKPDNAILFCPGTIDRQEPYAQKANAFLTDFKRTFPMFFRSSDNDDDDDNDSDDDDSIPQTRHPIAATRSSARPAAAATPATRAPVSMSASSSSALFHTPPSRATAVIVEETPAMPAAAPSLPVPVTAETLETPNEEQAGLSGWCHLL